jgi:LPXTG-motif cell wall-anchored protein
MIGTYVNSCEGWDIIVTYNATINDNASVGDMGNPNTAKLTYSNNANAEGEGIPGEEDKPLEDETHAKVTGDTVDSKTITYVTGIQLFKYDLETLTSEEKEALQNAQFKLEGTNLRQIKEDRGYHFREYDADKDGTVADTDKYYLLKNGTYTKTAPVEDSTEEVTVVLDDGSTATKVVKHHGTFDQYEEPTAAGKKYIKVSTAVDGTGNPENNGEGTYAYTTSTDADGILTFSGLSEGLYKLSELSAPVGFNILPNPIYVWIEWAKPNGKEQTTTDVGDTDAGNWTAWIWDTGVAPTYAKEGDTTPSNLTELKAQAKQLDTPTAASGKLLPMEVGNAKGTELPSTGGIGTTLFYAGGAILVLLAGILLVSKRRAA